MTQTVTVFIDSAPIQVAFYDANTLEAQRKAIEASDSAETAVAAKDVALLAAIALGPFADTTAGLAATTNGQHFYTVSPANLYRNNAGNAVLTDELATLARSLGTMTPAIVPDNATIKEAIEMLGENVEGEDGAGFVGLAQGGKVQHGIPYVTPIMKNAAGDGTWNDTAAAQNAIYEASARGWEVVLPKGYSFSNTGLILPDNTIIKGEGRLINTANRLTFGNGCLVEGIKIGGNDKAGLSDGIRIHDVADCVVRGVELDGIAYSGITLSNANGVLIEGLTARNIGDPDAPSFFATSSGMVVYAQNSSGVTIQRCPLAEQIYGSAAYFIGTGCTDFVITDSEVRDTVFRAFQVFGTGHRRIVISRNRGYRMGELNDSGSGIGCNGIYVASDSTDPSNIDIESNILENLAENGIEVLCAARIRANKIKTTGYRALSTPSNEGMFIESGSIVEENVITSAAFIGIRSYVDGYTASSMIVRNNTVIAAVGDAINFQANGSGSTYVNSRVSGNQLVSYGGANAVAISGTSGAAIGSSNAVNDNVAVNGAAVAIAADVRKSGNSWQW